jgi:WD40 repeat protein
MKCRIESFDNVHQGGLTSLKFMPDNQHQLVSAARKCNTIKCWDLRSMTKPIWSVNRACTTNQRIQFDISSNGKTLMSGSTDGKLHFWSLSPHHAEPVPVKSIEAHRSASNAVSLHPFAPICASGSGQRVFPSVAESDSEDTLTGMPVSDNSLTLWTAFNY